MTCPECGGLTRVLRTTREGDIVVRERICLSKAHRFQSRESPPEPAAPKKRRAAS